MRTALSLRRRFQILERDNFKCCYCGAGADVTSLEVDHREPVALDGDDSPENLITSCIECNRGKGARWAFQPQPCPGPIDDDASPQWHFRRERGVACYARVDVPFTLLTWMVLWKHPRHFTYQEAVIDLVYRSWTGHARTDADLIAAWSWTPDELKEFLNFVEQYGILYRVPKEGRDPEWQG